MVVPAAAWQRQVAALIIDGPATSTYVRAVGVAVLTGGVLIGAARVLTGCHPPWRLMIRRWHINDEVAMFAGTAIVVILIITLVNGCWCAVCWPGQVAFQPQNANTRPGSSNRASPKDQAARSHSSRGTRSVSRAATSSAPARPPPGSPT